MRIRMAKFAMISTVFLVVLLVMMEYSVTMVIADDPWADVNIYNGIPGPDTIQVDCTKMRPGKKHHIYTPQTLVFGQRFGWGFKPNIWGLTKYDCRMVWKTYSKTVTVWIDYSPFVTNPLPYNRPCTYCSWNVTVDGIYRIGSNGQRAGDLIKWV